VRATNDLAGTTVTVMVAVPGTRDNVEVPGAHRRASGTSEGILRHAWIRRRGVLKGVHRRSGDSEKII
jgi:hypothetical protein